MGAPQQGALRPRMHWLLAAIAVAAVSTFGFPLQGSRFINLGSRDGLSGETVYAITQDRTGYIWIVTSDGLNRYDGSSFLEFEHDPLSEDSLSDSALSAIVVGRDGKLWVGTWGGGVDILDPQIGIIGHVRHNPEQPDGLVDGRVQALFEDAGGAIWIGTFSGGLTRYDPRSGAMQSWRTGAGAKAISHNRIWAIQQSRDGAIWVATSEGIDRIDPVTGDVDSLDAYAGTEIRTLQIDRTNGLWVGTWTSLERVDLSSNVVSRFPANEEQRAAFEGIAVNKVLEDHLGMIWIGGYGGLLRLDPRTGAVDRYDPNPNRPGMLRNGDVRALYEDRSHVLWIGTRGGGVERLDLKPRKFHAVIHDPAEPSSIGSGVVGFVEQDDRTILIGTDQGLDRYDPISGKVDHLWKDRATALGRPSDINALIRDAEGAVWAGTWGHGLFQIERDGSWKQYQAAASGGLSSNRIDDLLQDRSGAIWIGTAGGLDRLDPNTGAVISYRHEPADPHSLSENMVTVIYEDRSGTIWAGTDNAGLNRLDRASGKFTRIERKRPFAQNLSNNRIRAIHESADGVLWIGTSNGLNRYDPRRGTFTHYFQADGLPSPRITGIIPIGDILWLGTARGVARFEPQTGRMRSYSVADGLHTAAVASAWMRDRRGTVYLGGGPGFTWFDPEKISDNPHAPEVVVTAFRKFGERVPINDPRRPIELSYRDNFFTFEFAALEFTSPERNQYAYRLEGLEDEWVDAGTRRSASYTSVPPGRYVFRVKGANADGIWNEAGAAIPLIIAPPVWQTAWFRAAAAIAILILIITVHRLRLRRLEAAQRRLEREVAERTKDVEQKNAQLEKMHAIVESINSETEFGRVLESILRITRVMPSIDHAMALVYDPVSHLYRVHAALGWSAEELSTLTMSSEMIRTSYLQHGREVFDDVFLVERGERVRRSVIVVRVSHHGRAEGFLIFESPTATEQLDPKDLGLIAQLKQPIASAFLKARMLEQLGKLNESKSEFVGIAAHDLRTPLGAIAGWITVVMSQLEKGVFDRDALLKRLGLVKSSAESMERLIADLLDLSAIESGRIEFERRRTDLRQLLKESVASHTPIAERKSIRLLFDCDGEALPAVLIDDRLIAEVVHNLVSNAIKYTAHGGEIRVWCERSGDQIVTHVRDNGQGLSEEDLKNVFRTFKRLSAKPTGGESSTGLGLAIVKKIVEVHGGRVSVDSKKGDGATFSFSLPVAAAAENESAA